MPDRHRLAIHWFRRDLRLADNLALYAAVTSSLEVVPVYVLSEWHGSHSWTGPNRQRFLCDCLESLAADVKKTGGRLILRRGDAVEELSKLIRETKADALFFHEAPDPFGRQKESEVKALCARIGIECRSFWDVTLVQPGTVATQDGSPYRVFTPFYRKWQTIPKPKPVARVTRMKTPAAIKSLPLPALATWSLSAARASLPDAGEKAALARLDRAARKRVAHYLALRDVPSADGTSRISQDLRFGLVSPRAVFHRVMEYRAGTINANEREGADCYVKEIAWREFYITILWHFPDVLQHEFNPEWRGLRWDDDDDGCFESWQQGRTGFPLVDAGMRELAATGFMHNRLRMITAMFLTKDLHISWRAGESHFMRHLVDGEIASNNGGWQWSAGTGADAAPWFRIQNPWTQTASHDPEGIYIKRWVPELAHTDPKLFLAPPPDGKPIARNYVSPIIDHARERARTLARFQEHKGMR